MSDVVWTNGVLEVRADGSWGVIPAMQGAAIAGDVAGVFADALALYAKGAASPAAAAEPHGPEWRAALMTARGAAIDSAVEELRASVRGTPLSALIERFSVERILALKTEKP